jgi:hypothetical protein
MSAATCIGLCVGNAMDFATVKGNQCYCSNATPDANSASNQCSTLCQGSLIEYCGGFSTLGTNIAISIYKRVVSLVAIPQPAYPTDWTFSSCMYLSSWLSLPKLGNFYSVSPSGGTDGVGCTNICNAANPLYTIAVVSGPTCYCATTTDSIASSLWAGLGECSTPCANNAGESCGRKGVSSLALGISYVRRTTAPSTTPPVYGTPGPQAWYNYGCYYGAVYLLDTILTGFEVSSLLDLTVDMSGSKCVAMCKVRSYTYALTISGICFCNNKPPTNDLYVNLGLL